MNSSSLSGSVHVGAFGSLATSSASLNAASNRSRFVSRESVKGILPVARHFLKKQVMAVVIFMPMSSKNSSASALRASSIRIVSEVVIAKSLSFVKTECIVSKTSQCGLEANLLKGVKNERKRAVESLCQGSQELAEVPRALIGLELV